MAVLEFFNKVSDKVDKTVSNPLTFLVFLLFCLTAPLVNLDATNYSISVITASLLFLGNGARRRTEKAEQAKLDALVKSDEKTDDRLVRIEDMAEEEIEKERCS